MTVGHCPRCHLRLRRLCVERVVGLRRGHRAAAAVSRHQHPPVRDRQTVPVAARNLFLPHRLRRLCLERLVGVRRALRAAAALSGRRHPPVQDRQCMPGITRGVYLRRRLHFGCMAALGVLLGIVRRWAELPLPSCDGAAAQRRFGMRGVDGNRGVRSNSMLSYRPQWHVAPRLSNQRCIRVAEGATHSASCRRHGHE